MHVSKVMTKASSQNFSVLGGAVFFLVVSYSNLEEVPAHADVKEDVDDNTNKVTHEWTVSFHGPYKEQDVKEDLQDGTDDEHDLVEPDDLARRLLIVLLEPLEPEPGRVEVHQPKYQYDNA